MKIQLQQEPQSAELQITTIPTFGEGFKSTIIPCQAPHASNLLDYHLQPKPVEYSWRFLALQVTHAIHAAGNYIFQILS